MGTREWHQWNLERLENCIADFFSRMEPASLTKDDWLRIQRLAKGIEREFRKHNPDEPA